MVISTVRYSTMLPISLNDCIYLLANFEFLAYSKQ